MSDGNNQLAQIYDEARYDLPGLLKLHQIVKDLGMDEKEIIKVLEHAKYDAEFRIPKGFTVAVEDECIFIHDTLIRRRVWTPEGMRPTVTVIGSHQKTCVFGTITIGGKQLFSQYDVFNQFVFLKYLKELQRKFRKLLLIIDRAAQHRSSTMIRKHLEDNKQVIRVEYLPKGSPGYNAVEECWRQGNEDLLVSKYSPKFSNLKSAIANYYRTKRFKLDITKCLFRARSELMLFS